MNAVTAMMPFEQCDCMALRRASRRITNFYDSRLAPTGLRVTQYAILALLGEHGSVSVNSLARHLDLDRTTMGKNHPPARRRTLAAAGSDQERRQGGRLVPNHAPTVAGSVLNQDIARRQQYLRAIVKLEFH